MPVPKKPRKHPKKKGNTGSTNVATEVEDLSYQRFLQANSILKQIKDNIGDILGTIPSFETSLSVWVKTGKDLRGSCEIESMDKYLHWAFHSDIRKYPEVWLRG